MINNKLLCFLLLLCFYNSNTAHAQEQIIVFENVNVITMRSPEVLNAQTVIIKNGYISAIDSIAKITIPKNAKVINGKGQYLMPGLADMHAHFTHPEASYFAENNLASINLLLANGITTVRNMWGSDGLLEFSKEVNSGKIIGPRIYTAGPFVVSRPDSLKNPWNPNEVKNNPTELYARTEEDGRAISRYHLDKGYDFVKVHNNTTLPPYIGLINEAAVPVVGHAPRPIGLAKILTIGKQSSIEHYDAFVGLSQQSSSPAKKSSNWYDNYFGSFAYSDNERILLLAELLKSSGAYVTPTLLMSQWYVSSHPIMLKRMTDPSVMRYTSKKQRAIWLEYVNGFARYYDQWNLDMTKQKTFALNLVNLFNQAGVPILLGTDATAVMGIQGIAVIEELELLVEAGLSPFEAIKTGTVNAHNYLRKAGLELGTGTIQVGEPADLIFLDANPLTDITYIKKISGVVTQGRWLNKEKITELTKRAEEIYTKK